MNTSADGELQIRQLIGGAHQAKLATVAPSALEPQ